MAEKEISEVYRHPNTIKILLSVLGLFSAYLFFIGWTYLTYYYYAFGLTTSSLNIPAQVALVYAYRVLLEPLPLLLLLVAMLYLLLRVTDPGKSAHNEKQSRLHKLFDIKFLLPIADLVILAAFLPLLASVSGQIAYNDAMERQQPENTDLPHIEFLGTDPKIMRVDKACSLRLLYYANSNFYVFCPTVNSGPIDVFIVPNGQIKTARVTRATSQTMNLPKKP